MPGRVYMMLRRQAAEQFGYVTTRDARDLGVEPQRLQKMKDRGVLEGVSRGVFRFPDVPAGALGAYAAATLWPLEVQGVLSHATALDLHGLCELRPDRIDVTVPRTYRTIRRPPPMIALHRETLREKEIAWHEGLPIVEERRAILGSIAQGVDRAVIRQAIEVATSRGRLTSDQAQELERLLA